MPHIESQVNQTATAVSATVAGGLNQRMRQLQEENDELYDLLKSTETGKLKDEVRSLRTAVAKLEGALKGPYGILHPLAQCFLKSLSQNLTKSFHHFRKSFLVWLMSEQSPNDRRYVIYAGRNSKRLMRSS
jgi:hypothetical protein